MKSRSNLGLLVNPFTRIAGLKAFGIGLLAVVLMGVVGALSGIAFNGVLDVHFVPEISFAESFAYLGIGILSVVLVMYVVALIASKNVRFVDVLGTMTLAKAPYLVVSFFGFLTTPPDISALLQNPLTFELPIGFILITILIIPFTVWYVAMMYNALKVSGNLKGRRLVVSFIIGLIVAEILSLVAILFV